MRHRAPRPIPRPLANLRRLPRATARLLDGAARLPAGGALVALLVLVGIGGAAYVALGSVTGGSEDRTAESAASALSGDGDRQTKSPDGDPSGPTAGLAGSDSPTPSPTSKPSGSAAERRATPDATASATHDDTTPPDTSLSAVYPAGDAATFSFGADESATFTCSLDGAAYTPCVPAMRYADLSPGWHTFAVRATDSSGNVDPSPAETRWHAKDLRSTAR